MKNSILCKALDEMIPNPKCELEFNKDYELLIAVMLSAQCTDKRVNMVTKTFFENRSLSDIANMDIKDIEKEIKSLGSYTRKAYYLKNIAISLLENYDGKVPCDRNYLESLPGVGHKTCNVVLAELFNIPTMAVDTHVERVSKRIGLARKNDDVKKIELRLEKVFDKEKYNRVNHQLLLFGRYICTAKSPKCEMCKIGCKMSKILKS